MAQSTPELKCMVAQLEEMKEYTQIMTNLNHKLDKLLTIVAKFPEREKETTFSHSTSNKRIKQ